MTNWMTWWSIWIWNCILGHKRTPVSIMCPRVYVNVGVRVHACIMHMLVCIQYVCTYVWKFLPKKHLHTTTSQFLPSVSNMNTSSSWAMCVKPTMVLICFWSVVPLMNDSSVTAIGTSLTHLSPILEMMYLEIHWKSWYGNFLLLSSLFLPWSLSSHSSFLPLPLCVNHFLPLLMFLCFPRDVLCQFLFQTQALSRRPSRRKT